MNDLVFDSFDKKHIAPLLAALEKFYRHLPCEKDVNAADARRRLYSRIPQGLYGVPHPDPIDGCAIHGIESELIALLAAFHENVCQLADRRHRCKARHKVFGKLRAEDNCSACCMGLFNPQFQGMAFQSCVQQCEVDNGPSPCFHP